MRDGIILENFLATQEEILKKLAALELRVATLQARVDRVDQNGECCKETAR